ncbi:hypothetical protein N2152v2_003828 [Parachlorella kessleri]
MPSVEKVPASSLHVSKPTWWLESRFHFSFAEYWDPKRSSFGALRVINDDLVKPRAGFGAHPHRDAEILSYVVQGELSHADSMGYKEALPRGCVQYLSAGTGITHSEMNDGDKTCRFLQIWLKPDRGGHEPQYGSERYSAEDRHNKLLHILGGTGKIPDWPHMEQGKCIKLHQDANFFVSESDPTVDGQPFQHDIVLGAQRQAYLVCIEGSLALGTTDQEVQLEARDGAKLRAGGKPLHFSLRATGDQPAHFMIIEMKQQD